MQIEPFEHSRLEAIVALSLRAWAPVFESIKAHMDAALYQEFYGDDWRAAQKQAVEDVCASENIHVWIAVDGDSVAGFVAVKLDANEKLGEIYMIASDPAFQGRGIGRALTEFAMDRMREAGMTMALVETGADPGHEPARRLYEKAGFGLWQAARFFKKL